MSHIENLKKNIPLIEKKLGYSFKDSSLLFLAFVHRSFLNENRSIVEHNERLEFLGDAVFGLLVSDYLFRTLPNVAEGRLSTLRASLVEASSCVEYVQLLGVAPYILLGRGERMNDGKGRDSILSDLFEAIIGAIYLDGGIEAARLFLFTHFSSYFEKSLNTPMINWKAFLQDYCQKKFQKGPDYQVLSEIGPDHNKIFEVAIVVNEEELGRGKGGSKKEAQAAAAANAAMRHNLIQ